MPPRWSAAFRSAHFRLPGSAVPPAGQKAPSKWAHRSGLRTRPPGPASASSLTREGRPGGLLLASPTQFLPSRSVSRPTLDSGTNAFGDYTSTVLRCVAEYFTFYVLRKMTSKKKKKSSFSSFPFLQVLDSSFSLNKLSPNVHRLSVICLREDRPHKPSVATARVVYCGKLLDFAVYGLTLILFYFFSFANYLISNCSLGWRAGRSIDLG